MDIQFNLDNVDNALLLMLMGMVGIFVVMGIILALIVILNKTTSKNEKDDTDKE